MLSINQLSLSAQDFQDSQGYNNKHNNNNSSLKKGNNMINNNMSIFDSQSSSRQLFRKCKQIIQQQMVQIARLSEQNERLSSEISQQHKNSQEQKIKTHDIMIENVQVKQKNELLHKQMSKLKKSIEDMNNDLTNKQNIIKLNMNKIELIEDALGKRNLQKEALEEKCYVLEQTVELLKRQLGRAEEVVRRKDDEMRGEIEGLRRVKMMLERNSKVEGVDEVLERMEEKNKPYYRPYATVQQEESPFQKVSLRNQFNPLLHHFPQKNQFYSAQLRRDHYQNSRPNTTITPFSIMDERQNTSPVSRIRKNISRSKDKDQRTPSANNTIKSSSNSRLKLRQTLTGKLSTKRDSSLVTNASQLATNPEMSQQLSSIKKQILQQYSKMEIKKGLISHDRINQTLLQIENKLQKMAKISAMDQSQSEFQ